MVFRGCEGLLAQHEAQHIAGVRVVRAVQESHARVVGEVLDEALLEV